MTQRTRIIHTIGAMVAGGAERAAVDLSIAMRREGLPVEFLSITNRQDTVGDQWQQMLTETGIPIHQGPTPRFSIQAAGWFRSQITQPDVAILHLHLSYAEMIYFGIRPFHRRRYGVVRKLANAVWPTDLRRRIPMHFSDIRHSIAAGEATKSFFDGKLKGTIHCIPNGRYFIQPPKDASRQKEATKRLGLNNNHQHYVSAGRMAGPNLSKDQKGFETLIKAWISTNNSTAHLHLLGDGNLRPQFEAMAHSCNNIHFHGVVNNVDDWLKAAKCFILASRWEGLPNAVVEAGATGTPLLLSDIPPMHEVGQNFATYFPVDNQEVLAEKIQKFYFSETNWDHNLEMAESIRRRFSVTQRIPLYYDLYKSVHPTPSLLSNSGT